MTQRRFSDDEVAAIFRQATETQQRGGQPTLPTGQGLTLAELQDIGREVGIAPELVAQAAVTIGQPARATSREFLGLPVGVAQTFELDRTLTDSEWERLVVDLRDTFDARGALRQEGSFRQWSNGNLQVLLEPTANGSRIRFRTLRANSRAAMSVGLGIIGVAALTWIGTEAGAFFRDNWTNLTAVLEMGFVGALLFAAGALPVPSWARLRRKQMQEIAGRLAQAMTTSPSPRD